MKLVSILAHHQESQTPDSLSLNLGDGFLLRQNPVFRHIRQKTLNLGFTYSTQVDPHYLTFPMGQLETILQKKEIPYLDNVTPLQNLNQRTAGALDWDHVVDNLKPNYVFHESCHAVARAFVRPSSDRNAQITATLMEESFANTCEFLAIAWAQDSGHRLFLELNSYFTVFEDRTHLKKAIDQYGLKSIFKMSWLSYLHSQFLNEDFTDSLFKTILDLSEFKKTPEIKPLKSLALNVFALNPRFRYTTTEMYLRLHGVREGVTQALAFDPFKLLHTDSNLQFLIQSLSEFMETCHD